MYALIFSKREANTPFFQSFRHEAFHRPRESKLLPPFTRAYKKLFLQIFLNSLRAAIEKLYKQPENFHSKFLFFPLAVHRWSYQDISKD